MNIAYVVGHKPNRPGAINEDFGITEYEFNDKLVSYIHENFNSLVKKSSSDQCSLDTKGSFLRLFCGSDRQPTVVFESTKHVLPHIKNDSLLQSRSDYPNISIIHRSSYIHLPQDIANENPLVSISFHANAFNGYIRGSEVLYYHRCETSKRIAITFQTNIVNELGIRDRGVKPIDNEDRGGYLLSTLYYKYNIPAIILEPFFIDNLEEFTNVLAKFTKLAKAIAQSTMQITKFV